MFCLQNASIKFETYHSSKLSFVNSHVHSSHNQWMAIMTIPGKTLHASVLDIITVLHKMDVEHHLSLIALQLYLTGINVQDSTLYIISYTRCSHGAMRFAYKQGGFCRNS